MLARARRGDVETQFWLGAAYEQGWFGQPDLGEAIKWYRKAGAQGHPDAQNGLGRMYEDGKGVNQDYSEAARWYRKAAEHVPDRGDAGQGRNNLGLLYLDGLGVPRDLVQAYKWFLLAGTKENLAEAKTQMTNEQIRQAEHLAAEWRKSRPVE